jgi:hypothetical protein
VSGLEVQPTESLIAIMISFGVEKTVNRPMVLAGIGKKGSCIWGGAPLTIERYGASSVLATITRGATGD